MNPLKRLPIAARLALGFGLLLAGGALIVVLAMLGLSRTGHAVDSLVSHDWVKAGAASTIDAMTRANARRTMELFLVPPDAAQATRQHIAANRRAIDEALHTLDRLVVLPEGRAMLDKLKAARGQFVRSFGRVDELLAAGQREEATRLLLEETLPTLDGLQGHVQALAQLQGRLADAAGQDVQADVQRMGQWLAALALGVLLMAVGLAWWLSRGIAGPIEQAVRVAEQVAQGELGHRIESTEGGETGRLVQALATMDRSLAHVVGQVRDASESIVTGSTQIAGGTTDLSQRTEEQAANLEQTAASMEELAGTIRHSADSARRASRLAQDATEAAAAGGTQMAGLSGTMAGIREASQKIADILSMIDGIAFQTNILALNAAVEAARAGEHGRGFAVVAGEVRALAQRSAGAARDIKGLLQANVERVEAGSRSVDSAGRQIEAIVLQTRQVSETITQISDAAAEQTRGIDQVNVAISQLDQVTQQNAALVEESAAASDSLRVQAERLVDAVRVFRIKAVA